MSWVTSLPAGLPMGRQACCASLMGHQPPLSSLGYQGGIGLLPGAAPAQFLARARTS